MKTSIRKIPAVLLLVILCLTVFPISALAAEVTEVKIPVSVELSGKTPSPEETYTVVLQSVDGAPMPSESTLKIKGSGTAAFPAISYSTPGIYCYTVTQQAGSHERGQYDETVYYVKVAVTNAKSDGLEAVVTVHTDAQMTSAKQDVTFTNTFDVPKTPSKPLSKPDQPKKVTIMPKTGDNTNLALLIGLLCVSGCGVFLITGALSEKA
ncbi:MAG TPA: LPXTG cell wall anchor domain-containing protein [Candidatus Pelethocola excrementipullorum]|nr:LPXTG cell wall anchor domain-containing protein [Candidatus Pelethocola excrementipullorum]